MTEVGRSMATGRRRLAGTAGLLAVLLAVASALAEAPPPATRPWDTIVIHHSATASGSAALFHASHRARGMVNGLAYHFVINNGSEGLRDGFIESGNRWRRQLPGGHCRQSDVNDRGIGICLVGDFTSRQPTERQFAALVLLIRGLQQQFQIADDRVLGHGKILGEFSECPGRSFPWAELRRRLQEPTP